MAREIRFELDDDQFEKMRGIKQEQGRTWAGLFVAGVRALEGDGTGDSTERLDGLKHNWIDDERVFPHPGNDRIGSFKAGWTKAENGEEFGPRALRGLSWHNLGWRLGMVFEDTPTELKRELYQWCVKQQEETKREAFATIREKVDRLDEGMEVRVISDSGDKILNQRGTVVGTNPPRFDSEGTVYTIRLDSDTEAASIHSKAVDRPIRMLHLPDRT